MTLNSISNFITFVGCTIEVNNADGETMKMLRALMIPFSNIIICDLWCASDRKLGSLWWWRRTGSEIITLRRITRVKIRVINIVCSRRIIASERWHGYHVITVIDTLSITYNFIIVYQTILNALIVTADAESVGLKHHVQVGAVNRGLSAGCDTELWRSRYFQDGKLSFTRTRIKKSSPSRIHPESLLFIIQSLIAHISYEKKKARKCISLRSNKQLSLGSV